jgi:hypothetical protein
MERGFIAKCQTLGEGWGLCDPNDIWSAVGLD